MKRTRLGFSAGLVALSLVFLLGTPGQSRAAEYSFHVCPSTESSTYQREWQYFGNPVFGLHGACGQPWYQSLIFPHIQSYGTGTRSLPIGPGRITQVQLEVAGRDRTSLGMYQAFAICNGPNFPSNCGHPRTGATEAPYFTTLESLTPEAGDIPEGADQLLLFSECLKTDIADPCPTPGEHLEFSNVYVTADDSDKPVFDGFTPPSSTSWLNTAPVVDVDLADATSGLLSMKFYSISGASTTAICDLSQDYSDCPLQASLSVDTSNVYLKQGANTVTVEATDRAQNTATRKFNFHYDTFAPDAPDGLTGNASPGDWIVGDHVSLRWNNGPEREPTSAASGVTTAVVKLVPEDGSPVPDQTFTGVAIDSADVQLPRTDDWSLYVRVVDAAGNESDPTKIVINNELTGPEKPTLHELAPINLGTVGGTTIHWDAGAGSRSGNCGYRGWIGTGTPPDLANDPSTAIAGANATSWSISASGLLNLSSGTKTVALAAVDCAGVVSETDTAELVVDREVPSVTLTPNGKWLANGSELTLDGFELGAAASGIASVWYQDLNGGPKTTVPGSSASIVLTPGNHRYAYGATDNAGNTISMIPRDVGVDEQAPTTAIVPAGLSLGEFNANVSDPLSGVVEAWVELAPTGGSNWSRLGDRFVSAAGRTSPISLAIRVPDDGSLAPGNYVMRVLARDEAGNFETAIARTIQLPLRSASTLTAGISKPGKPASAATTATFDVGDKAVLLGTLRNGAGAAVAGGKLRVVAQRVGGGRRLLAEATTGADGGYAVGLGTDVSRTLTVFYDGDSAHGSATATASENVRTRVSMRLTRSVARVGSRVDAVGRVTLLSAAVPSRGVPVQLQYCGKRSCSRLVISTFSDSDGGFRASIPTDVSRRTRFVLRARVQQTGSWPFVDGVSPRRTLVVR